MCLMHGGTKFKSFWDSPLFYGQSKRNGNKLWKNNMNKKKVTIYLNHMRRVVQ